MTKEKPREHESCPECGQSLTTTYAVSRGLRDTLKAMARFIEEKGENVAHIQKELMAQGIITHNQKDNLHTHGVYTGLVAHADEPGNYLITKRGWDFLDDKPVPKYAYAAKRTKEKGTHVIGHSEELCRASDFNRKGQYWEVPGFVIQEGRVLKSSPWKAPLAARKLVPVRNGNAAVFVDPEKLDQFLANHPDAKVI